MQERVDSVISIRYWSDKIPLNYLYSVGIAGERFYSGLKEGKIIGSRCNFCKKTFLPPRIYCLICYRKTEDYVEIKGQGIVVALTEKNNIVYGFIKFGKVVGGIIHKVSKDATIGSRVKPIFKSTEKRNGDISDIEIFTTV